LLHCAQKEFVLGRDVAANANGDVANELSEGTSDARDSKLLAREVLTVGVDSAKDLVDLGV
jgi:hypothetical protein